MISLIRSLQVAMACCGSAPLEASVTSAVARELDEGEPIMLPVQRQTRTQGKKRRSHDGLTAVQVVRCPNCGSAKKAHAACGECGYVRPGLKLRLGKEVEA